MCETLLNCNLILLCFYQLSYHDHLHVSLLNALNADSENCIELTETLLRDPTAQTAR